MLVLILSVYAFGDGGGKKTVGEVFNVWKEDAGYAEGKSRGRGVVGLEGEVEGWHFEG